MTRTVAKATLVAALALVALWAFAWYLHPSLSGEVAGLLLRCN